MRAVVESVEKSLKEKQKAQRKAQRALLKEQESEERHERKRQRRMELDSQKQLQQEEKMKNSIENMKRRIRRDNAFKKHQQELKRMTWSKHEKRSVYLSLMTYGLKESGEAIRACANLTHKSEMMVRKYVGDMMAYCQECAIIDTSRGRKPRRRRKEDGEGGERREGGEGGEKRGEGDEFRDLLICDVLKNGEEEMERDGEREGDDDDDDGSGKPSEKPEVNSLLQFEQNLTSYLCILSLSFSFFLL